MIYLSGAMAAVSTDYAKEWRASFIKTYSFFVDNPSIFDPTKYFNYDMDLSEFTDKELMDYEFRMLNKSSILVLNLEYINKSVGTIQELAVAHNNGIPVVAFHRHKSVTELKAKLHPWIIEQCDKIFTGNLAISNTADYVATFYGD